MTHLLSVKNPLIRNLGLLSFCSLAALGSLMPVEAGEVELKAIEPLDTKEKKWGPYVGVFAGASQNQEADVMVQGYPFDHVSQNGAAMFGLEIGHSWRMKKVPLEFALEFEGFYTATEFSASINRDAADDPDNPAPGNNLGSVKTDLNAAVFMVNGSMILDLRKFRPRLGKVPTGFRPYIGGGLGGAQMWFRNTETSTVNDVRNGNPPGTGTPTFAPFDQDQFVLAYQVFAGLEYQFTENISAYAEFRRVTFEKFDIVREMESEVWGGGIHLRY
jgi:opacity protein-like surface antigen